MQTTHVTDVIREWPDESREAAELVLQRYGEPDETTPFRLIWHGAGPWKRIVATRESIRHAFPVPHTDSVESVLAYRVPPAFATPLAEFDGSVVVERTAGEVSARCHDEEANNLALNLMHDIVTGARTVDGAREHYKKEFLDHRRKRPTPYMDELRVPPAEDPADPDERVISDEELERAGREGGG